MAKPCECGVLCGVCCKWCGLINIDGLFSGTSFVVKLVDCVVSLYIYVLFNGTSFVVKLVDCVVY